jgi:hypothetical protein
MKTRIWNTAFNFYLWISKFGYRESSKNSVYDNLGLIDTLGSHQDRTRFTKSYTEELGSIYSIKLPFGCWLNLINYFGKEISITRN